MRGVPPTIGSKGKKNVLAQEDLHYTQLIVRPKLHRTITKDLCAQAVRWGQEHKCHVDSADPPGYSRVHDLGPHTNGSGIAEGVEGKPTVLAGISPPVSAALSLL